MTMRRAPAGKTLAICLLGLVVAGGSFGACAQGAQGPGNSANGGGGNGPGATSSTGTQGGGGSQGSGSLGDPCKQQSDCKIGKCTDLGDGKYCTTECPPECPGNMYCGLVNGKSVCVPNKGSCEQCSGATSCKFQSDHCLDAPAGDSFCANDCTTDGMCPNGFQCVDGASYPGSGSGSGGGGTGGAGGAGTGGAGVGGGVPGQPTKFCVPSGGASCPCDDKRDGVTRSCDITNTNGTCSGSEVCDANKGKFVNCSAKTPKKETCNGKDDNCNMQIDEGDPNSLCSSMGPPPPHSNWVCQNAMCKLGACDPGWTDYPGGGPPDEGCPCKIDGAEPNDTGAQATNAGTVSDSGSSINLTGTLSSDTDVDVYSFNTTDTAESGTDSYHVKMVFTEPATNNEFQMDVERGTTCTDTPTGGVADITSYDWCVNGNNGTKGLAPCGNVAGEAHCADMGSKYFVRVHRKTGAAKSCDEYKIVVTAGNGACDFSQTCP